MNDPILDWKRYWTTPESQVGLHDDGFLQDPDTKQWYGVHALSTLSTYSDVACLGLLGEPGIGKSRTIEQEVVRLRNRAEDSASVLTIDLRSFGSEDRLVRGVFDHPQYRSWETSGNCLYLFLDSLDECALRVDNVAAVLLDELQRRDRKRLRLRIACRTAEWPSLLQSELPILWREARFELLELLPLRRADVLLAAKARRIDGQKFLHEIIERGAAPLANKPVTLNMLLQTYETKGQLPATAVELYRRGLYELCREQNTSRERGRGAGALDPEQRLSIASRIGAITVFGARSSIRSDRREPEADQEVSVRELARGTELAQENELKVTQLAVSEVLAATGLFNARGVGRVGWAHQTYAEFLAADYLVRSNMGAAQISSLLMHADDPTHVVPQLRETAAWLASLREEFFSFLLQHDPQVLLRSDVAKLDSKSREHLVAALLSEARSGAPVFVDWSLSDRVFGRLAHSNLEHQLRPLLEDQAELTSARILAARIASSCQCHGLEDLLADLALRSDQDVRLRGIATEAIAAFGDRRTRVRLRPLATLDLANDRDTIKTHCLRALWPESMTTSELFGFLSMPADSNHYGIYREFVDEEVPNAVRPQDLPAALRWVARHASAFSNEYLFNNAVVTYMELGWDHLNEPEILDAFVEAALARMRKHENLFYRRLSFSEHEQHDSTRDRMAADHAARRLFIEAIIKSRDVDNDELDRIVVGNQPITFTHDLEWLLERAQKDEVPLRRRWAKFVRGVYGYDQSYRVVDLILRAVESNRDLASEMETYLKTVHLDSEEGRRAQDHARASEEREHRRAHPPSLDPSPSARVSTMLNLSEDGDPNAWWELLRGMTLQPTSTNYGSITDEIVARPGWRAADEETRARIVAAAMRYLTSEDATWRGISLADERASGAYRALRLLVAVHCSWIYQQPTETWSRWAPLIVGFSDHEPDELLRAAYKRVPESVCQTLVQLVAGRSDSDIYGPLKIAEQIWDDRVAKTILRLARGATRMGTALGPLLESLLAHDIQPGQNLAVRVLRRSAIGTVGTRSPMMQAALALVRKAPGAGWKDVWRTVQRSPGFGRELFLALSQQAFARRGGALGEHLCESDIADLHLWLVHQFPPSTDPPHHVQISDRESIAHLRDGLLQALHERGTIAACEALAKVYATRPGDEALRFSLHATRYRMLEKTWRPATPDQILALGGDRAKRLIQSGAQLMEVVLECLRQLEGDLQGISLGAQDLWDRQAGGGWRPKDETAISDYVVRHLRRELRSRAVTSNREVSVRRSTAPGSGEITDILVEAATQDRRATGFDRVQVAVETKGAWNHHVKTDIETQLKDRYLADSEVRHGIYLVGWFSCPQWDAKDPRRARVPFESRDAAAAYFDDESRRLSDDNSMVRAIVLDAALRGVPPSSNRKAAKSKTRGRSARQR